MLTDVLDILAVALGKPEVLLRPRGARGIYRSGCGPVSSLHWRLPF
jgi:hypothetical protein